MNEEYLTEMFEGYTSALVWAEIPLREDEHDNPDASLEDRGYTTADFSADAMIDMRLDCASLYRLIEQNGLEIPDHAWNQCGMDLYFTRQGHGTGFWDRADLYGKEQADRLDRLVQREFSETYAWIDGNNRIQVETYTPRSASCDMGLRKWE